MHVSIYGIVMDFSHHNTVFSSLFVSYKHTHTQASAQLVPGIRHITDESVLCILAQAAYIVSTAGAHEVVVLAGGKPVPGSPFRAEVSPGQVSAGACQLSGPGLSAIQLGRDMRLFVALADAFGNAVTEASAVETADVKVPD